MRERYQQLRRQVTALAVSVLCLVGARPASAQLKAMDTAGVKLGATAAQVKQGLLAFRSDFTFEDRALPANGGVPRRVVWLEGRSGSALGGQSTETIKVTFSLTTGRALSIYRLHIVGSAGQRFSVSKMLESFNKKYGGTLTAVNDKPNQLAVMAFTPEGKRDDKCANLGDYGVRSHNCGYSVVARFPFAAGNDNADAFEVILADGEGYIAEAAAQREAEQRRTGGSSPRL